MNLIWRFLLTIITAYFHPQLAILDESRKSFRVLPTDIDLMLHMNNGRYFSFLDLARLDYIIRCNLQTEMSKHKIYSVVASEMIRFRKSIDLFKCFEVRTKILGWDERFLYIAHHIMRDDTIHALALVKSCFLKKSTGSISPQTVLNTLGLTYQSPALPAWVTSWQEADKAFHDEAVKESS